MNALVIPIASLLALVLAITVHEFSHALSADLLGDSTARYMGRVTLNPLAHFDPIGGLMILVSSFTGYGFGWGKPVPVNPVNLRFGPRVGLALTSFAGPFSNIALATLFAAPWRIIGPRAVLWSPTLWLLSQVAVSINVGLAVFNMLPIYPLDGFSVLRGILSTIRARWAYQAGLWMDQMVTWGPMIFVALMALSSFLPVFTVILGPLRNLLLALIWGGM